MIRSLILSVLLSLLGMSCLHAGSKTKISFSVSGYTGKEIYVDFIEKPEANQQFQYMENQAFEFEVELEGITMMKINSWIWICLRPGEEIHADIRYDGRRYETAEFAGTPGAVQANNTIRDMRKLRAGNRYRNNIATALALQIPVLEYYQATLKEWKEEIQLLDTRKEELSEEVYNYLKSEHEGMFLSNLIDYPFAKADYTGQKAETLLPADFWHALDGYQLRSDKASLRSRSYMGFLLPYQLYACRRDALKKGEKYEAPDDMQARYDDLVAFYDGDLRECALVVLLFNLISGERDLDQVQVLVRDFNKKYSRNKLYRKMLNEMLK